MRLLDRTDREIVAEVSANSRRAIDNFLFHHLRSPMLPSVLVHYEREPYFSRVDDYARVTFDRSLSAQRATKLSLVPEHDRWAHVDDFVSQRGLVPGASAVVLELKFSIVPGWMRRMVHTLDLHRLAFCKYTRAIDVLRTVPHARIARAGFWR